MAGNLLSMEVYSWEKHVYYVCMCVYIYTYGPCSIAMFDYRRAHYFISSWYSSHLYQTYGPYGGSNCMIQPRFGGKSAIAHASTSISLVDLASKLQIDSSLMLIHTCLVLPIPRFSSVGTPFRPIFSILSCSSWNIRNSGHKLGVDAIW